MQSTAGGVMGRFLASLMLVFATYTERLLIHRLGGNRMVLLIVAC